MSNRTVTVTLAARAGQFIGEIGKATDSVGKLTDRLSRGDQFRQSWDTVADGFMKTGAAALLGVGAVVKTFADFDKAMAGVASTGQDARTHLEGLRETAIQVGADTAFSSREAAQGMEELLKAGVSARDVMGGGLKGAMDLAAAGSLSVAEASEIAATAMTQFKLSGADVPHIADLLAAGAGKAQGSVHDMGMALKQSGLVASQFGLSIESTVGALSAFASYGLIGSDAGTSFKQMLLTLANPSKESARLMGELGINAYDTAGNFVGLESLAGQLQTRLSGLTQAQRDQALAQIFGSDAVRAANILYQEGAAGIANWTAQVNEAGYAAETAAIMQDNLAGDLEKLGGSFESLFIKAGSGGNDFLRSIVQMAEGAVDALGKMPPAVSQGVLAITAFGGAGLLAVGATMKMIASVSDGVAAFRTLGGMAVLADSGVRRYAIGAAVAAAALVGVTAASGAMQRQIDTNSASLDAYAKALQNVGKSATAFDGLNRLMAQFGDTTAMAGRGIDSTASAFRELAASQNPVAQGFKAIGDTLGMTSSLGALEAEIGKLDTALTQMQPEQAAQAFARFGDEMNRAGLSMSDQLGIFDDYRNSILSQADALGVTLTEVEQYWAMMGRIPPQLAAAQAASEGAAGSQQALGDALAGVGESASDAAAKLLTLANAYLQLSGSQMGVEAAIDAATASLQENGRTLDITTEKGRANQQALDNIAASSLKLVESQTQVGASSAEIGASMDRNRAAFISAAEAMGMSGSEASALADKYGLVSSQAGALGTASSQAAGDLGAMGAASAGAAGQASAASQAIGDLAHRLASVPDSKQVAVSAPGLPDTQVSVSGLKAAIEGVPDDKMVRVVLADGEVVEMQAGAIRQSIDAIPAVKTAVMQADAALGTAEVKRFQVVVDSTTGKTVVVGTSSDLSGKVKTQVEVDATTGKVVTVGTKSDTGGQRTTQSAVNSTTGKTVTVGTRADVGGQRATQSAVNSTTGKTVTVGTRSDTSGARAAQGAVNAVQGKVVYITTVHRTIRVVSDGGTGGGITRADGGLIPRYAGPTPAGFESAQRLSAGGQVAGYSPHPRADNIPIWATAGELMMSNAAGDKYGRRHLLALNAGLIDEKHFAAFMAAQGFASGGQVGSALAPPAPPVPEYTRTGPTFIINNPVERSLAESVRRTAALAGVGG